MSATPTLSTPRLLLRPATVEDAPAVQALFSSWEVIQHMSLKVPWPFPPDGAIHWLRDIAMPKVARGEVMLWALTLRELGDQAIGILEWRRSDTGDSDGRGFWIAPAYQGRGLMTEAVVAFQDYVFFEEGVERLVVFHSSDNVGSRRIKEKTGGQFLDLDHQEHHSGAKQSERWEVTRESWAKLRGR